MTTYGLLISEGAEELDFTGPWEVFTASAMLRDQGDRAVLVAERPGQVRCDKGMRVLADHAFDDHPPLDVLLVPGGMGTRREVSNPAVIDWIRATSATVTWTTSVCTGALLLHEAGPARGRRVATHHDFEGALQERGDIMVVRDAPAASARRRQVIERSRTRALLYRLAQAHASLCHYSLVDSYEKSDMPYSAGSGRLPWYTKYVVLIY
jgi:putative intracellular protease/amidase